MASRFDSIIGRPTDRPPVDNYYTSTPRVAEECRLAAKNGDTIAIGSFRFSLVSATVHGDISRRFVSLGTTQYFAPLLNILLRPEENVESWSVVFAQTNDTLKDIPTVISARR